MYKETKNVENAVIYLEDREFGNIQARLKWDGCIDFKYGHNGIKPSEDATGSNTDYIHICDIDDMIKKLQGLKEYGQKHFKNEYWE